MSVEELDARLKALEDGGYYTIEQLEEDKTWYDPREVWRLYKALGEANRRKREAASVRRQIMAIHWQNAYDDLANEWFEAVLSLKAEIAEIENGDVADMPEEERQMVLALLKAEVADLESRPWHVKS